MPWKVTIKRTDGTSGREIILTAETAPGHEAFLDYCERAIQSIQPADGDGPGPPMN